MFFIYNILLLASLILYLPYIFLTGRYHKDFWQRFGFYPKDFVRWLSEGNIIWLHAVSVGEVNLIKPLWIKLREELSGYRIVCSTITKTGYQTACSFAKKDERVCLFPIDLPSILYRLFKAVNIAIFVIAETEMWPNTIRFLNRRKVPIMLINGRISDASYGRYKFIKRYLLSILSGIDVFCMRESLDKDRIIELGAPKKNVFVTGNMKFDLDLQSDFQERVEIADFFRHRLVIVAGSTHEGEEDLLLEVYKDLRRDYPALFLVLAPRHINRISSIERVIGGYGFRYLRFTEGIKASDILLVDTFGQLPFLYSVATIVIIGGSFIPHGGHNIIEPAFYGKPVLFGPYMFNFREIVKVFLDEKSAIQVNNLEDLKVQLRILLTDEEARIKIGKRARETVLKNRGATAQNLKYMKRILGV